MLTANKIERTRQKNHIQPKCMQVVHRAWKESNDSCKNWKDKSIKINVNEVI